MALRLIDHAAQIDDPVQRGVIEVYARATDMLGALPFVTVPSGTYKAPRQATLPTSGFRAINAGFTESTGTTEMIIEHVAPLGGDIDVDELMLIGQEGDARAVQEQLQIISVAQTFDFNLIKGSIIANRNGFQGLQERAGTDGPNVLDIDGALSLAKLDQGIEMVDQANALYMSKAMRRRLTAAARNSSVGGQIDTVINDFGKQVMMYNGLPILIADPNGHGNKPLAFNETNSTSSAATTSIYVLRLGQDGGVFGIQSAPPRVTDLGELDAKPSLRSRVKWNCGLFVSKPDSFARLRRVTDAAVTA